MDQIYQSVKELLYQEVDYPLPNEDMDAFLTGMEILHLKRNDVVILSGSMNKNIYVVQNGVLRFCYMNGLHEQTYAFSLPGTMIIPMYPFYANEPAFYQVEACCDSVVVKITKKHYDEMVATSHQFAQWALKMSQAQLYFFEKKNFVINGNATERFIAMVENRPDLIQKVPMRIIASYLNVTQSYLCRLKKRLLLKHNQKNQPKF